MGIEYFQNLAKLQLAVSEDLEESESTKSIENLKSLGESKTKYSFNYNPHFLEAFANPQTHTPYEIEIDAPEFTCVCPKTGQPDFARILVTYSPDRWCVESKSFKLYLGSFRNEGMFHEDCVNRVARDLNVVLDPHWIQVTGEFFPRGGIAFHPKVMLRKKKE